MRRHGLTFLTVVTVAALTGCGGGGGGSDRSKSAAAGATPVRTMPSHRAKHTATALPNGDVFVAGGVDIAGDPVATTIIITPSSILNGPDMASARVGHSATLLASGDVLVAGGSSDAAGAQVLATSELFDPVTSTFTAGPALTQARRGHVAGNYVRANGEFVLIAGGEAGVAAPVPPATTGARILLDTVEVIDVAAGTSAAIPQRLAAPQADARLARLDTGSLLIVSGQAATGAAPAQVFDPVGQSFSPANVVVARQGSAVVSRGREVLVAGGQSAVGVEDSSEVYDSITRTFAQGVRLGAPRRDAAVAAVGTNDVVIVGGRNAAGVVGRVEKLTGAAFGQAQVTALADLTTARDAHTATSVGGTKLIVVGGLDAQGLALNTIETIDLAAKPATTGTTAPGATPLGPGVPGAVNPLPTVPTPTTTPTTPTTTPTTGSGSGGLLGGLLGGLFGGSGSSGSSSGGGSIGSTLLNAALQAAVSALTNNTGGGFSGFLQAFIQNLVPNLINGLLGGGSSGSSSGSGLSGILSSLLGGLTGSGSGSGSSSSSGFGSILSSLLGALTGGSSSTSGSSSSGLGSLLSGLFGGSSGSSGSSSGGLGSLLSGLFGGSSGSSSGSSSGGLGGLLGSLFGGGSGSSGTPAAPTVSAMSPGFGAIGTTVTVTGANFGSTVSVVVNGRAAAVLSSTSTSVRFTIPTGTPAGTGPVTITTNGQTVLAGNFNVQ